METQPWLVDAIAQLPASNVNALREIFVLLEVSEPTVGLSVATLSCSYLPSGRVPTGRY